MRNFRPMGQVTGIGSLPHTDPADAMRFVAKFSPAIPFWPQLPQRSADEMMLPQMLTPLLDLLHRQSPVRFAIPRAALPTLRQRLRDFDAVLDERSAAGFFAFERACQTYSFPQAIALKGHITGPMTLGYCIFVDGKPLAALPDVLAELTQYVYRLGLWQIQRLHQFNKPVLLFIDEPALGLSASAASSLSTLESLVAALRATGAYVGIHCCAFDLPDFICRAAPDIISFDAHQGLETFLLNKQIQASVGAGNWLALGMVPTWMELDPFNTTQAFMRLVDACDDQYDLAHVASHTLITATCGLGLL